MNKLDLFLSLLVGIFLGASGLFLYLTYLQPELGQCDANPLVYGAAKYSNYLNNQLVCSCNFANPLKNPSFNLNSTAITPIVQERDYGNDEEINFTALLELNQ